MLAPASFSWHSLSSSQRRTRRCAHAGMCARMSHASVRRMRGARACAWRADVRARACVRRAWARRWAHACTRGARGRAALERARRARRSIRRFATRDSRVVNSVVNSAAKLDSSVRRRKTTKSVMPPNLTTALTSPPPHFGPPRYPDHLGDPLEDASIVFGLRRHWIGCSMQAWQELAAWHGYLLLWADPFDLVFGRRDIVEQLGWRCRGVADGWPLTTAHRGASTRCFHLFCSASTRECPMTLPMSICMCSSTKSASSQ